MARWLEQFAGAAGGALFTRLRRQRHASARADQTELSSVLPARRRAGGRGPRRPHPRSRGEDYPAQRDDPRPAVGDDPRRVRARRAAPAAPAPARRVAAPSAPPARSAAPPPRVVPPTWWRWRMCSSAAASAGDSRARSRSRATCPNRHPRVPAVGQPMARPIGGAPRCSRSSWRLPDCAATIRDARDEGGRLLAEYHVRVREPAGADEFEC